MVVKVKVIKQVPPYKYQPMPAVIPAEWMLPNMAVEMKSSYP